MNWREKRRTIKEVSRRTGLTVRTVKNLLNAGWTYTERIHSPLAWTKEF